MYQKGLLPDRIQSWMENRKKQVKIGAKHPRYGLDGFYGVQNCARGDAPELSHYCSLYPF
jgi:hypothetical protein